MDNVSKTKRTRLTPCTCQSVTLSSTQTKSKSVSAGLFIQQAKIRERDRIAQELHDGIVQQLVAAEIFVQNLDRSNNENLRHELLELRGMLRHIGNEVRDISHNLSSSNITENHLGHLIGKLISQVNETSNIRFLADVSIRGEFPVSEQIKTHLYRTIQELVTNVIRHSKASQAVVAIRQSNQKLQVIVSDNGQGLSEKSRQSPGIGLDNIKRRIDLIKGNISFDNKPTGGLQVSIEVPLYETNPALTPTQ
ncbi:sensor histidine kinase [Marinoscillum furvescens]|uniref:Oxygen sensor histidine kinase NreB n=1 Tax=Marinoscillum furvescens DSM 4134 TaxID=1122208 RepID=A0A3D9L9P4_MARFU|nr:sensor histidine kinase [Marinoscillum furvescens]REE02187.1 histidine kinase/DNA gyrase B/HSP90-like ATPase [Marinoscillum furvescens DSM 4134]